MSQLAIYLLGTVQIELNKQPVELRLRKGLALLAFLAVEGGYQQRDRLATLLWPGYGQRDARANLRRTLSSLNQALPGDWLLTTRQTIGLNPAADIWIDVQRFRELSEQTHWLQALIEAAELARGPFLAGFTLDDAPEFDEWQSQEAQYWSRQVGQLLERLARHHAGQQMWAAGVPFAQRWVALDSLNEEANRLLMLLYAQSGERNAALEQQPGVQPSALKMMALPPQSTSILGREAELELCLPLLREGGLILADNTMHEDMFACWMVG